MQSITKAESETIDAYKSLLMIAIILIHCKLEVPEELRHSWLELFQYYIHIIITSAAIPAFFLLSGFWLYRSYDGTWNRYITILKKRVQSLLIPYLFWNIFVFCIYFFGPHIPYISTFFQNDKFPDQSFLSLLDITFGFTQKPIAYQFWFIRNLFLYILLYPLFFFFFRLSSWGTLSFLLTLAISGIAHPIPSEIFFFMAGGMLANDAIFSKVHFKNIHFKFIALLFLAFSLLLLFHRNPMLSFMVMIFEIPTLYCLAGSIKHSIFWNRIFIFLSSRVFFLYATHAVFIVFVIKVFFKIIPYHPVSIILGTFLCPLICIIGSLIAFEITKKIVPSFLKVVCGGRI